MPPNMMTTAEAAEFLGIAQSTLEKARVVGTGCRFAKLGRTVRYRRSDLEEYLTQRIVCSTSDAGEPSGVDLRTTE